MDDRLRLVKQEQDEELEKQVYKDVQNVMDGLLSGMIHKQDHDCHPLVHDVSVKMTIAEVCDKKVNELHDLNKMKEEVVCPLGFSKVVLDKSGKCYVHVKCSDCKDFCPIIKGSQWEGREGSIDLVNFCCQACAMKHSMVKTGTNEDEGTNCFRGPLGPPNSKMFYHPYPGIVSDSVSFDYVDAKMSGGPKISEKSKECKSDSDITCAIS